jgi:hypothetical protein
MQLDDFVSRLRSAQLAANNAQKSKMLEQWFCRVNAFTASAGGAAFSWTAPHAEIALVILAIGLMVTAPVMAMSIDLNEPYMSRADRCLATVMMLVIVGAVEAFVIVLGGTLIRAALGWTA